MELATRGGRMGCFLCIFDLPDWLIAATAISITQTDISKGGKQWGMLAAKIICQQKEEIKLSVFMKYDIRSITGHIERQSRSGWQECSRRNNIVFIYLHLWARKVAREGGWEDRCSKLVPLCRNFIYFKSNFLSPVVAHLMRPVSDCPRCQLTFSLFI